MPLILISGFPSSGKTHRSLQLVEYLNGRIRDESSSPQIARLKVHHITDQSLGLSRHVYHTARAEKDARATAYSAVKRLLTRDDIVIADGMNYIKGFRYQLYCEAKAVQTASCVVHVGTPVEKCREFNARLLADAAVDGGYAEEDFENLVFRYEEPNGMTRWDSPLFTVVFEDDAPPFEHIWDAIIGSDGRAKLVRPNQATVLKPSAPQNYLYELDRSTSDIVALIQAHQRDQPDAPGAPIAVPSAEDAAQIHPPATEALTLPQLQRLRRQFIALNRQHAGIDTKRISNLFVDYLNDQFQRE